MSEQSKRILCGECDHCCLIGGHMYHCLFLGSEVFSGDDCAVPDSVAYVSATTEALQQAQARIAEMEAGIDEYAQHTHSCARYRWTPIDVHDPEPIPDCTCGLDALRNARVGGEG